MSGAEARAYARAYAAVDRALSSSDPVMWAAEDAFKGFQRLHNKSSYGVSRDTRSELRLLLAKAWLHVENATQNLENKLQRARDIKRAIGDGARTRRLYDAIQADALRSLWIGLDDPRLLSEQTFIELENVRNLLKELPSLETQARALLGFSLQRIRGVGAAQRGAVRQFIHETSNLVFDQESHGKFVTPLICPVLGIDWLTPDDVRKHLAAYRA